MGFAYLKSASYKYGMVLLETKTKECQKGRIKEHNNFVVRLVLIPSVSWVGPDSEPDEIVFEFDLLTDANYLFETISN
ncbi:hypothetical protein SERVES_01674 [Serratia ficaria]|uniref:hypothetical protein n=1 Tax=Serratia ficaria TaxID=61651 RepID=UPI00119B525E|nr:hypothetical protein [Serratia ficaria]VVA47953.1 hypothetical protein SERVES_01674 [Serratia ficaria]